MPIDTRPTRLSTLKEQADRLPPWQRDAVLPVFDVADSYLERLDEIRTALYQPKRESELTTEARTVCVRGLGLVYDGIDRAAAIERAHGYDSFDGERNTRALENRRLVDVVDVADFASDDARRVRSAVETAGYFGLDGEAKRLALEHVRPRAADEMKRHRQNGPWFALMCALSERTATPSDRSSVGHRVDADREQLRRIVRQVADVIGVVAELTRTQAREETPAPLPDGVKPSVYTMGRWWDEHPEYRR